MTVVGQGHDRERNGGPRTTRYRRRLRSRIIVSFLLLGFGLTSMFAVFTLGMRSQMENELVESWLQREARAFLDFKRVNPQPDARYGLSAQQIEFFAYRPTSPNIPFGWTGLPTGIHDLRDPAVPGRDGNYLLVVERQPDMVVFLKYWYGRQTLDEQQILVLLGAAVLLFSVLAGLIGLWSSRRVMSPVADLAAKLRAIGAGAKPEPLAPHFADDEVGQLAASFDAYAERLTQLVRRDREFNADVSHELRTPLAVIKGATELLAAQPGQSEKAMTRLRRIERAVQQCTDLIEALLMLSRSERGSATTDVRRVVEQIADSQRLANTGKPIDIVVEGEATMLVDAPEAVVSVALGNLIGNAVKYTSAGTVRIAVHANRVEVHDNGPGIDPEDAGHLFERGYRGKRTEGSKGAGIGLAIVSRLCELYGWEPSIAPHPDGGAMATLKFR